MKSPERRRNVVSDWMSLVMSSIYGSSKKHLIRCYQNILGLLKGKVAWKNHEHSTSHVTGIRCVRHPSILLAHPNQRRVLHSSGRSRRNCKKRTKNSTHP